MTSLLRSSSSVTLATEVSSAATGTINSTANIRTGQHSPQLSIQKPVIRVVVPDMTSSTKCTSSDAARLLFSNCQNSFQNMYAFAQANLVQQTQQDIMKMFSPSLTEQTPVVTIIDRRTNQTSYPGKILKLEEKDNITAKEDEQPICQINGCGRQFVSMGHLRNHQNAVHRNGRDLQCPYEGCGRRFCWPSGLKYHLLTHQKTKNFECSHEGCGKTFLTAQQLFVHSRTHTGIRPFQCEHCDKAFGTASNLRNHVRTHTGDRPFECPEPKCFLRFAEISSLKKHQVTHTGEKPFKCPVCCKGFTQRGSMKVHMKKHTQNENVSSKMEDTTSSQKIDYQVIFSDYVQDNIVTVTTESDLNETPPVSNEMLLAEDLFSRRPNSTPDTLSAANVVVLPLPQLPVSMATSFENIQSVHEEIILGDSEFLQSPLDHEEIACDIQENGE